MALEIFKLFGSIFVDSEKAEESISKTDKKAQNMGSTLLKGVGTAAKWGVGIATAAGTGAAAITGFATSVADTMGDIDDMAQRTGSTAEEFQKYAYAAKLSGMETASLEKIMIKQQKAFADAKEGSKSLGEAYSRLGINIDEIGNSGDAFDAVIMSLADIEDETERNALANDIFGKSYADLAPLLNSGSEGIQKLKQEAVDLGSVMSNEAVEAGAEFGDSMDRLKTAGAGMVNSLGTSVIPIVKQFVDMILQNMPMIQGLFAQLAPVIAMVFTNLLPPIMDLVQNLLPVLISLFASIMPVVSEIINMVLPIFTELLMMLLPPLIEIVQAILPPLLEVIMALMPILQTIMEILGPIIELVVALIKPIIDLVMTAVQPLVDILAGLVNVILKALSPAIKVVSSVLNEVLGGAIKYIKTQFENIKTVFQGFIDFFKGAFTGNWKMAFEGLKNIVSGVMDGVLAAVKWPINSMINLINGFIKGINKIKIPDWVPGVGGKGFNISELPLLADGGTIYKKGSVIVGDAGPEILELPVGAKVTPLNKSEECLADEKKEINLNLNLHIDTFINNTTDDIERISNDLGFLTKRKLEGGGGIALGTI